VELAQQVATSALDVNKILLGNGPDISADPRRRPLATRFEVTGEWRAKIAGRHVLVVDDTWVSGARRSQRRSR
jgi:hypothetical protein